MDTTTKNTAIVLAAHGVPASDYPHGRVAILMALEHSGRLTKRVGFLRAWRESLDEDARAWPRTPQNDPYKAAVDEIAAELSARLGGPVFVGYNEFCAPTIAEAIGRAAGGGARSVIVLPTMLVRGNEHTEREIRETAAQASERHPQVDIRYAWPFDQERLIALLADQAMAHVKD